MSANHKLENILAGIGSEPVPEDIHQLAEAIAAEFRQRLTDDPAAIPVTPLAETTADGQADLRDEDDLATSRNPTPPMVRLVPDAPTELADGVQRETHSIPNPPSRRHVPRRLVPMLHSKTFQWLVAAAVAAALMLAVGLWPGKTGSGSGSAFASALQQFQKAKTIVCRVSSPTPVSNGMVSLQQSGKLYVSSEYGSRLENLMNGTMMSIWYTPLQGPMTVVTTAAKQYAVIDTQAVDHSAISTSNPELFILALSKLKGQASRELGRTTLDGIDSLGYEITGQLLGLGSGEGVRSELWVDAKSFLPVRYLAEMPMPQVKGGLYQMVYDQFEWNTVVDPQLFVPQIPADYVRIDAKAPAEDEAALIKGLDNYAKLTGKYPPAMDASTITVDFAAALGARIAAARARGEKQLDQQDLMQKAVEIGSGLSFYQKHIREGHSSEYFGKTVAPGQASAVLLRWKPADGQWRVVYGDLRIETIED